MASPTTFHTVKSLSITRQNLIHRFDDVAVVVLSFQLLVVTKIEICNDTAAAAAVVVVAISNDNSNDNDDPGSLGLTAPPTRRATTNYISRLRLRLHLVHYKHKKVRYGGGGGGGGGDGGERGGGGVTIDGGVVVVIAMIVVFR